MFECSTCTEEFWDGDDCHDHMDYKGHWIECETCNQHMNAIQHWAPTFECETCTNLLQSTRRQQPHEREGSLAPDRSMRDMSDEIPIGAGYRRGQVYVSRTCSLYTSCMTMGGSGEDSR